MSVSAQNVKIEVVGSSTFGVNPKINAQKTYNLYISDEWLFSFPGYRKVVDLLPKSTANSNVEGRAFFRSIRGQLLIAIIDASVFKLDESIGETFIGLLNTSGGRVYIAENLSGQIGIVDGLNLYIYNRNTNTFTTQTIPSDLSPTYICYHNTYFLVGNGNLTGNGAKWYVYQYASETTVEIAYTLALQTKSDYARLVSRLPGKGNNVIVLGTTVGEIHTNVGGLLGYQRVSTLNIDYGLLSIDTFAASDTFVVWVGINESNSPCICVFDGSNFIPISSDGITYFLNNLKNPQKSNGCIFKTDTGHLLYLLTFYDPQDNVSLIYDFNTKKFFHVSDYNLDYHPARQIVYANNTSYFISFNNGAIYELSSKFKTLDENSSYNQSNYNEDLNHIMPRQRICNSVRYPGGERFIAKRIRLEMQQGIDPYHTKLANLSKNAGNIISEIGQDIVTETGEIIVSEQAAENIIYTPGVDLSFSKDGAVTFSHEVRHLTKFSGQRVNMMTWDNLGTANDFTPKFKFWSKSDVIAGNAVLEVGS